jgi:hypothetical protein
MTEKIKSTSQFSAQVILTLSEQEARALLEITGYGAKAFLEVFYKHLGKCDLQDYEEGVKSLFETIKTELPRHLSKIDDVKGIWNGTKIALPKSLSKD